MGSVFKLPRYTDLRTRITHDAKFWRNLPPITAGVEAFKYLNKPYHQAAEVLVLTSPGHYPVSASAKLDWCEEHLGIDGHKMVITTRKELLAQDETLLIDDSPEQCEAFCKAGGRALLVAQPWSFEHAGVNALSYLKGGARLTVTGQEALLRTVKSAEFTKLAGAPF
jgi:5'(3')-deoxyribonucleotidase